MKAFLMYKDQDFDLERQLPANEQELVQDLELNVLFNAMASGDEFLLKIVKQAFLLGSNEIETIVYRQNILKDCLKNPSVVRDIYRIPLESVERKRKQWLGILTYNPGAVLHSSLELLQMFVGLLKKLKKIADDHSAEFESEGFTAFFSMIKRELDDDYFAVVENHLRELKFRDGVLISAELGRGNEGENYILRKPVRKRQNRIMDFLPRREPGYSFSIHPRDDNGSRALGELRDRAVNLVANALGKSADHIDSFLNMLRVELAYYIGCINLYENLSQMGAAVSFPLLAVQDERRFSCRGLSDVCLVLTKKQKIVGNDIEADRKDLVIITGANQGGKSTFLRSVGLAQMMMQCGMFVAAEFFSSNLCDGIFTHYRRKEDASIKSGKLDEELSRMDTIADAVRPNSMVLFNESFAATNELEGSEIARQITAALLEKHIKVIFVTHQYEFARGFYNKNLGNAIFLRAERKEGGERTFKITLGEPLQTSYGEDVYKTVFESADNNEESRFAINDGRK